MPSEGLHQLNHDIILDCQQLQVFTLCLEWLRNKIPFEAVLMWGTDRLSKWNQADVSVNPQDDCLKQKCKNTENRLAGR